MYLLYVNCYDRICNIMDSLFRIQAASWTVLWNLLCLPNLRDHLAAFPPKLKTIAGMGGGFRRAQTLGSFMLQGRATAPQLVLTTS
jgi:hypothetical protein